MGSQLHQALRYLCSNTGWRYAVFWKLKHRARMMLTLEDAYYSSGGNQDKKHLSNSLSNLQVGHSSHDPLGIAVAKMSYHVHCLGEGIVGQVALAGKHLWISADKLASDPISQFEEYNEWQAQFSAGIKTIAVVAVAPHGVVQLGSSENIAENFNMVNHIRGVFLELQSLWAEQPSFTGNSCQSDVTSTTWGSELPRDCLQNLNGNINMDGKNSWSTTYPSTEKPCTSIQHLVEMVTKLEAPQNSISEYETTCLEKLNQEKLPTVGESSRNSENQAVFSVNDNCSKSSSCDALFAKDTVMEVSHLASDPLRFCAGYELYEALGPAFQKQDSHSKWVDAKRKETIVAADVSGVGSINQLTVNPGSEYLLDAVVANAQKSEGSKIEKSPFCKSESHMDPEKFPEPSTSDLGSISSAGYRGTFSSSVASSLCYSKGFSSGSETLERSQEPNKMQKKRARPGESCRPRPRDRQLIQDRIKELRELVPNGSKCSIDSLLERTIKHMVFMQGIAKHGEKLSKCPGPKFMDRETGFRGSSCPDQGSSWAVEVGNNLKVCPIIVENLNTTGQLLVEMLCDECSQFLEVAEAIRGMGLTVLKGVTESYGEKTWMRFVVEGQNNGNMHRMDVLWTLMQLLQPKLQT